MGEEQSSQMEVILRAQEEMREQMQKTQEQMMKMMEMMAILQKGKGVVDDSSSIERHQNQENLFGPSLHPMQTSIRASQIPTPPTGSYVAPGFTIPTVGGASSNTTQVPDLEKLKNNALEPIENLGAQKKYDLLEERLRAMEGIDVFCSIDASELNLVPGLVIPPKFKPPEFEKYDGTKCPMAHITMYCRKMAAHAHDDKLLIHCFQDSLKESATRWYNQLDRKQIRSWKDLARAFIAQYKHVADMAPDRFVLQNIEKKATESFREYARRWRDIASQVQPPLTEKETTAMFIHTLRAPYFERLIGNATKDFADMVISGEIIESAIKQGKIEGVDSKKDNA